MIYITRTLVALAFTLGTVSVALANSGKVILAKGVVTATDTAKNSRVLTKGAAVKAGDIVSTSQKSFAVIRMIDNTKLTLKPGTTIAVGVFSVEEGKEEGCINLVKGGLRTVTGLIGKRKPEAFQVDTPIASIGIRGTDFITRICAGDECLSDEQELQHSTVDAQELAAQSDVAESINQQLPEGLYGSCETGAIAMTQCAGQAKNFKLGKCRFDLPTDCVDVVLEAGQAGYASLAVSESEGDAFDSSESKVETLPSMPLILSQDPYFALSDLSDADLEKIDRFPLGFNRQGQCSIYGG